MISKYRWLLVSTFSVILSFSLFTGVAEQARTEETWGDRSQNPIPQSGSIQKNSKASQTITVDGVTITVEISILPAAATYTSSIPGDVIQVATAATWHPFREVTITAVPFGTKTGAENLPTSRSGGAGTYEAALMDYRSTQGRVLREAPIANIFGQQVVGFATIVNLNIDGPIAKPTLIMEWVVEAGKRLWIVRASQELPLADRSFEPSSDALSLGADLSISSDSLHKPSTILETIDALRGPASSVAPEASASLSDLPAPYWWNGYDCDSSHYYAGSGGRSAFRLGAVYLGMPACGPRPIAGGPDVSVTWGGGATQLEWECPELSKRYLYLAYAVTPYLAHGSQVVWNYSGTVLDKISNGTTGRAPQPGDVLSYGSTSTAGHTSVVMTSNVNSNGNGSITVIEENNSAGGSSTLSVSNWTVNGNAGSVSGWLHNGCASGTSTLRNRDGGPPIHPPGSLIKTASNTTVYLIDPDNRRRPVSASALSQLYNQSTDARTSTNFNNWVITVGQDELDLYEPGGSIFAAQPGNGQPFPDGKLISYNGQVSIVTGVGRRRPFVFESTFTGLGFNFCQVVNVSAGEYNSYPLGPPVDAMVLLTSNVNLSPAGPYTVGQNILGAFTIKNVGYEPIPFSSLGMGGRLNGSSVYDMNFVSTTLAAGSSYAYGSQALQLTIAGTYDFFAAYQESNGHWAISVPAASGVIRSRQITVTNSTPRTLTVTSSNPNSGVSITVSPNDNNNQGSGSTQFTRTYNNNTSVNLTAPATASGNNFQKWQRDGSDWTTNQSTSVIMDANHTMTAVYTTLVVTRTLTVASSNPSSGVSIAVSPNDNNNQGSGVTQFTRLYNNNVNVTLTAPSTASGNNFQKWQRDGVDVSASLTATVTMDASRTMTAVYGGCTPAVMTSPTNGSTFTSSTVTFNWTTGTCVTRYWIFIGSSAGAYDLLNRDMVTSTSVTATTMPTDGRTVYVTLWSWINGAWQSNAYTYTANTVGSCTPLKAAMTSPANGSTFTSSTVTFNWTTGSCVTRYWIFVGSSAGAYDLLNRDMVTSTSVTTTMPTDGRTVYVTLWSWINGAWQSNAYTYTAQTVGGCTPLRAAMTSPANGSTFPSSTVTFNWTTGSCVTRYWIFVGSAPGAYDLFNRDMVTSTSVTTTMPTDGRTVYVTLWSWINGGWQSNEYTYRAHTAVATNTTFQIRDHLNESAFGSKVHFVGNRRAGFTQYWPLLSHIARL